MRGVIAALLVLQVPAQAPVREEQQWVLDTLNVEQAWRTTKGAGVTVAVIDSAVDPDVKELRGRVTVGPDMSSPEVSREVTPGRHGTAMAGLIAASGADGGYVGVAPEARVLSLPLSVSEDPDRVDPPLEGDRAAIESPLARALRYAVDHGAQVVSMSIGTYGAHRSEREAVSYALGKGVVLVAAVGNDGQTEYAKKNGTSYWSFPAGYPGVIGVAAVDKQRRVASYSSDNLSVLVAAPGSQVPVVRRGGYELSQGTSSAAALVSGVAALVKARHPGLRPDQVAQALVAGARGRPATGYDEETGFGVVDAAAALNAAAGLAGQRRSAPVPDGQHFGQGEDSPAPSAPGPDPLRLWLYGIGVLVALVMFCGGIAVLNQRRE